MRIGKNATKDSQDFQIVLAREMTMIGQEAHGNLKEAGDRIIEVIYPTGILAIGKEEPYFQTSLSQFASMF